MYISYIYIYYSTYIYTWSIYKQITSPYLQFGRYPIAAVHPGWHHYPSHVTPTSLHGPSWLSGPGGCAEQLTNLNQVRADS